MAKIKITVWVHPSSLEQFQKEWGYLFDARTYYAQHVGSFKYKGVRLYLEKIGNSEGSFVQLQLNLQDYNFWIKNTKDNE
jgi:predicted glycosyltransferase involved in capsule biosynthesis